MIVKEPRLELARTPTPVEVLGRLSERHGVELRVKRDDLTGVGLSGNKVRKLEFLVSDALARGANTLVTCGGAGSNHCRATAVVAARLGLGATLLLRTDDGGPPPEPWTGNLLIARMTGARIRFVSRAEYAESDVLLGRAAAEVGAWGGRPYVIVEGGSDAVGSLGYARAYGEILEQWPEADVVVTAMGSGGTAAGLVMGRRRALAADRPACPRVVAVNVCDDEAFFRRRVSAVLGDPATEDLQILDGFQGRGYARSTPEEMAFIADVAATEGLLLDPVYTGKAFRGMVSALASGRLEARRVLFVHTGGVYGLFPEAGTLAAVYAKSVKR